MFMYMGLIYEQLALGYFEFFERLTGMMERIGIHLSYLSMYSKPIFQESEVLQKVRYNTLSCMYTI